MRISNGLICVLLLFSITFVVFQYTVDIREPWFGDLSLKGHQWQTGSTIKFSANWYTEGPLKLRFAMLENPDSIEFPTLASRDIYTAYPPGSIIPIYILSRISGHKTNPALVMSYNLFNHFLIAFFLSMIIFFFLLKHIRLKPINAFTFAIIPIMIELLMPGPLYWHQNVFFADEAVILPFVLYIFLEVLRDSFRMEKKDNKKILRILNIIQNLILFYGFITDWLFVFIAFTVYIKRIIDGEINLSSENSFSGKISLFIKENIKFWIVPIFASGLFLIQLLVLETLNNTISKVLVRSGISSDGSGYEEYFLAGLHNIFKWNYGHSFDCVLIISLTIFLLAAIYIIYRQFMNQKLDEKVWSNVKLTMYLMGMLFIPCMLQIFFFSQHSVMHYFSVLKFIVPLSTIPFVLLPILVYILFSNFIPKTLKTNFKVFYKCDVNIGLFIIFLLMSGLVSATLVAEHPHYKDLFPPIYNNYIHLGKSIENNTGYNDVVFSPDFELSANPPQQLSYSMKRVYLIDSTSMDRDIKNITRNINGRYNVIIMFWYPPDSSWTNILKNSTVIKDKNIYYYKFSNYGN